MINMSYVRAFSRRMLHVLRITNKPKLVLDEEIAQLIVKYIQQRGIKN